MLPHPTDPQRARAATYHEMQRAVPGLGAMYRLVAAVVAARATGGNRLLIAGAGGGREIEALGLSAQTLAITAIDPSSQNLQATKYAADRLGLSDRITFLTGTAEDLPPVPAFDMATSLLVMHYLRDDGAKLAYLTALKTRLADGGTLIHADLCHDGMADVDALMPAFKAHASHAGIADEVARIEIEAARRLPVVSPSRTRALFTESGFAAPREIFRSLWYRCWICTRPLI